MARNMSASILGKTFGFWLYKDMKDIAMLQQNLHHSHPFVTLPNIGINEEETKNALITVIISFFKNKNAAFKTFEQYKLVRTFTNVKNSDKPPF
ncbi:hypothetical protein IOC57_12370 [Bacillus sp. SD075]|uniref:hypothetical protein n=1 Tax=Bacillus sp. SD075 TaxID=2781732 RepID=UPI001A96065E|nr:hypothetical protein [Bacillus sp. SD075]MBO0998536.1 hypothetical protein [Bacillus sp. SD075]